MAATVDLVPPAETAEAGAARVDGTLSGNNAQIKDNSIRSRICCSLDP